mmetsp:Transcript_94669/g.203231  ORF Transcript_94669/g.203231 Transcript_94669/m.203231 type:complete len:245 (-) Transcript_94669:194-928(-)
MAAPPLRLKSITARLMQVACSMCSWSLTPHQVVVRPAAATPRQPRRLPRMDWAKATPKVIMPLSSPICTALAARPVELASLGRIHCRRSARRAQIEAKFAPKAAAQSQLMPLARATQPSRVPRPMPAKSARTHMLVTKHCPRRPSFTTTPQAWAPRAPRTTAPTMTGISSRADSPMASCIKVDMTTETLHLVPRHFLLQKPSTTAIAKCTKHSATALARTGAAMAAHAAMATIAAASTASSAAF